MKKILVVEDDNEISKMLTTVLSSEYQIIPAFSGTEGLLQFANQAFDLVLLDIMLLGKTGEEVLSEIREQSSVPIIMLTALSDKKKVSEVLLKGSDDYISKPFDIDELKVRMAVQLRRSHEKPQPSAITQYKSIQLDADLFQIRLADQRLPLARKEFQIFQLLVENQNKIYTKADLYEKVWEEAYFGDENTVNVHISNLRKKLKLMDPSEEYIEAVWSIGIKLAD